MVTVTDILNKANEVGVFSYVLPFLIIFAVVFAILQKSKILGQDAKGINAVVAIAIGLLSLLNDVVPTFFASIFPRMGVFLAIIVVILIFLGFFIDSDKWEGKYFWIIGLVIGLFVVFWGWENWANTSGFGMFDWYFFQNSEFWTTAFWLIVVGVGIWAIIKFSGGSSSSGKKGP
jgi:hypothetical protein